MKYLLAPTLLVCSLCSQSTVAVETPDAQYIAELFLAAQKSVTHFPDVIRINPDMDESLLYDIQQRFVRLQLENGSTIGGYKGGFIPKSPIGGVLFADGILQGAPTIERANFQLLLVEAEIAFRLCQPLSTPLPNVAALKSLTCEIYPAIELPDAAVPDLGQLRNDFGHLRRLLIPTNMAVSHVLLGAGMKPGELDLDRLNVKLELDGEEFAYRDGATSTDDIWARVLWVINEFVLPNGYTISPDHFIIPGSLTGLHPGKPGNYRIDYGDLGTVEFTVRQ